MIASIFRIICNYIAQNPLVVTLNFYDRKRIIMKLKSALIVFVCMFLVATVVSCGKSVENLSSSSVGSTFQVSNFSMPEVEIYQNLDAAIRNPEGQSASLLLGNNITFAALILSDPVEMSFPDSPEQNGVYQYAMTARGHEEKFLLNVDNLESPVDAGNFVKITGKVQGSLLQTVEQNKQARYLEVVADNYSRFTPIAEDTEKGPSFTIKRGENSGEFDILGCYLTTTTTGEEVLVTYFNFTNYSTEPYAPAVGSLYYFINDILNYVLPEDQMVTLNDPPNEDAFNSFGSFVTPTEPGEQNLYYLILRTADAQNYFSQYGYLFINTYNDNFDRKVSVKLPISDSSSDVKPPVTEQSSEDAVLTTDPSQSSEAAVLGDGEWHNDPGVSHA